MRCKACDLKVLTRKEAARKSLLSGEYFDLCNKCFDTIKDQVMYSESEFEDDEVPQEKVLFDETQERSSTNDDEQSQDG